MNLSQQLVDYVNAAFAGIWIQTHEPDEAEREILQAARQGRWKTAVWDICLEVGTMSTETTAISLTIDPQALRPLIETVVSEAIARLEERRAAILEKIAYAEEEAARLLGLEPHQLRDERRRGRISFSRIMGRRIRYTQEDLVQYLVRSRSERPRTGRVILRPKPAT